jgi:hypothetical protein
MKIVIIVAVLFALYCFMARFVPATLMSISVPWLVVIAGLLAWFLSAKIKVS